MSSPLSACFNNPCVVLAGAREPAWFTNYFGHQYVQTNGTMGGLGQFFQPYDGTSGFEDIKMRGIMLSQRPVRLIPSFLPNSLLDNIIEVTGKHYKDFDFWFCQKY